MDIDQKIRQLMDEAFRVLTTNPDGLLTTSVLASMKLKPIDYPHRMAVCSQTRTLYVNADWFEKLPVTQRAYVMAHEATHPLLGHGKWLAKVAVADLDNGKKAIDLAVFSILAHTALDKLRGDLNCWAPADLGLPMDMTVDQYLTALKDKQEAERPKPQEQEQQESEDGDDDSAESESVGPGSEDDDAETSESDEQEDGAEPGDGDSEDSGDIDSDVDDGDDAAAGDDPGADGEDGMAPGGDGDAEGAAGDGKEESDGLKGLDDVILDDGSDPGQGGAGAGGDTGTRIIDALKSAGFSSGMFSAVMEARKAEDIRWETVLADFMEKNMGRTVCSYSRPHRAFLWRGVAVPGRSRDDRMRSMALYLDTSMSIDDSAIQKALGTVSDIVDKTAGPDFELHMFQFSGKMEDYKLYQKRDFPLERCDVYGRGGTSLLPTFQYMMETRIAPAAIIIITDGYISDLGSLPVPPMPVLWLIDGCYQSFTAPFGIKVPLY